MLLIGQFSQYFFGFSIFITSMFLIMLVLVQRGRGGGLTGALGGAGGQSAFGTKAGDLFTRITVGVAAVWIFLCASAVFFLKDRALPDTGVDNANVPSLTSPAAGNADSPTSPAASLTPAAGTPAAGTPAAGTPAAGTPATGTPAAGTPGVDPTTAAPGSEAAPGAASGTPPADSTP